MPSSHSFLDIGADDLASGIALFAQPPMTGEFDCCQATNSVYEIAVTPGRSGSWRRVPVICSPESKAQCHCTAVQKK